MDALPKENLSMMDEFATELSSTKRFEDCITLNRREVSKLIIVHVTKRRIRMSRESLHVCGAPIL